MAHTATTRPHDTLAPASAAASWLDGVQAWCTANLPLPVRASDWRGLKAFVTPPDPAVYPTLLPAPLEMPAEPLVLIEFAEVTPTWHEGIVSIACRFGDAEGWHGLYWAIDSYLPYAFGRFVGYPKFLADRMTLTRDDDRWRGEVVHRGRRALAVEFGPATVPDDDPLLARLGGPATERPYFLQVPAGAGPWINRLGYTEVASRPMTERAGRLTVAVDVDEPWAALFPDRTIAAAGKLLETRGTGFGWLTSQRVWTPGDPSRP